MPNRFFSIILCLEYLSSGENLAENEIGKMNRSFNNFSKKYGY